MTAPRQDAWGRMVEPNDSTMSEWFDRKLHEGEHCDLCGERNPIEFDAHPPTGLWICTQCVEATLEGATSQ